MSNRISDIPELQGLSLAQQKAAVRAVIPKAVRHWQVWLSFLLLIGALYATTVFIKPGMMLYAVITVVLLVGAKLVSLPFNYYICHYLSKSTVRR